ncbi:MAG: MutS2 family protein [Acidobacteria bacterium OLB17]|nr:MAG: MutS2 family protein [Acidobacteria bacterium OLB17]MCZ2391744.1 endonuclease MutS2 [Acidobacteriota bacterium]
MSYSLDTLEFDRLLALVAKNAQTDAGAALVLSARPFASRLELERSLSAVKETLWLSEERDAYWTFSNIDDPANSLAILRIENAALDALSLTAIAALCSQALAARSVIEGEKANCPTLSQIVSSFSSKLSTAMSEISRKILPGGEIDDSASPELAKIRREINSRRAQLTRTLESAMRSAGNAIQDAIVTIRNDRFVIPVKSDFRGKVSGVAHGFSSSGQTVYIEPLDTIDANNEIQNLKGLEEREIGRILHSLTGLLREHLSEIEAAADAVAELDAIKAKTSFARNFDCIVPSIAEKNELDLDSARHPLLEQNLREAAAQAPPESKPRNIVPSTFSLTESRSVMIISGANAGGKTVVLKTAGLLSLMAISGFPVPAKAASIPFYRSVLADIGDHQSLNANLSTFSSHMSNIASMIDECSSPALILLDEAGTGTDPEEGSALGVAIVDHFRRACGAHVIASTHYRGLKMYAANDTNVVNASVEFDEKSLEPTYRLLTGLAGASSGIEIARRFGIRDKVIEEARRHLDTSAREAEAYLQRLQTETRLAEDLRVALEEEREAVASKFNSLEKDAQQKEKAREREFETLLANAVEDFDRQSKAFLETIRDKALKNRLEKERSSRKAELNRAVLGKLKKAQPERKASQPNKPFEGDIDVGSAVTTTFGNVGTVERIDDDVAQVVVGNIRIRQKISELFPAEAAPKGAAKPKATHRPIDAADVAVELNLIGKTTADAEYELDRFLDEAYLASSPRVRIIHGFGTGALKNYVHHFLKNSDLVERFEFAPSSQGGHGATIAELKQ